MTVTEKRKSSADLLQLCHECVKLSNNGIEQLDIDDPLTEHILRLEKDQLEFVQAYVAGARYQQSVWAENARDCCFRTAAIRKENCRAAFWAMAAIGLFLFLLTLWGAK